MYVMSPSIAQSLVILAQELSNISKYTTHVEEVCKRINYFNGNCLDSKVVSLFLISKVFLLILSFNNKRKKKLSLRTTIYWKDVPYFFHQNFVQGVNQF